MLNYCHLYFQLESRLKFIHTRAGNNHKVYEQEATLEIMLSNHFILQERKQAQRFDLLEVMLPANGSARIGFQFPDS